MAEEYKGNPLWHILVETAQNLPMYRAHLNYIKDVILPENPKITPEELSQRLRMPLGEAFVILSELEKI
ncbi:hypothetical protein ACFL0D_00095 [Thermoproteota archaeon]